MQISHDYIRGLIDGEGSFTFCSAPTQILVGGQSVKVLLPAFILSMHKRDKELIKSVIETLGLRNKIYTYKRRLRRDNYDHGEMSTFLVRDIGQLKNIIVPFFYKKLIGYKGQQFQEWIQRIETDARVPEKYKVISLLYNSGFYDRNNNFR